jgi:hypothetical protein
MPGADVGGLLRSGVAYLCLAAGVLHVSAAADHRGMAGHVAFFLVVAVGQSALGAAILLARPGRWLALGAGVNLAVALVWVLSRTTGLPVDGSSPAEAIGFKDGIATMIEMGAAAGAGLWWLLPDGARRVALPSGRLAATMLGTGVWAVGAAALFAGHAHSPGHTHAAQHAHATGTPNAAPPNVAAHPHGGDPGHHGDQARPPAHGAIAAGPVDGGHTHAAASQAAPHADHHHGPQGRAPVITTSAAGAHDHGSRHHSSETQPASSPAAVPHHDHIAPGPAQGDSGQGGESHAGDHRHSGDNHDHNHEEGGSGESRGDEDGGASPLEDILKLIQPR